jgi:hypothetical protein
MARAPFAATAVDAGRNVFTNVDRSLWYDLIGERREGYADTRLRRASSKTGDRSTSGGDRSNFEGNRSNFEHYRGKSSRAGARIGSIPCQIVRRPRQL